MDGVRFGWRNGGGSGIPHGKFSKHKGGAGEPGEVVAK
jgi:hypothetical protein